MGVIYKNGIVYGGSENKYDIVQSISYLPSSLPSTSRKLYYIIEDQCFYLWDGTQWVKQAKPATYSSLGLVKVNENTLNVDNAGEVSIRTISSADLQNLFN